MIKVLGKYVKKAESSPIWLTVFCDMTTNLMLFFLLLYGFTRLSNDEQQKMYRSLRSSGNKEQMLEQKASRVINEYRLQETESAVSMLKTDDIDVKIAKEQIRLSLNSPILFSSGSAELNEKEGLRKMAMVLKKIDNKAIIEGHTDDIPVRSGRYSSNWELSVARSVSIIEYLVKYHGFSPDRFIAAGYGEYHPKFPNDTAEHRAANRRIEVVVLK